MAIPALLASTGAQAVVTRGQAGIQPYSPCVDEMANAFGQECPADFPAQALARDAMAHVNELPREIAVQYTHETLAEQPSPDAEAEASGSHMTTAVRTALMLGGAIALSTAALKRARDYMKRLSKNDLAAVQVVIMAAELDVPITAELIGALLDKTPSEASAYFRHFRSHSIFEPDNLTGVKALQQVSRAMDIAQRGTIHQSIDKFMDMRQKLAGVSMEALRFARIAACSGDNLGEFAPDLRHEHDGVSMEAVHHALDAAGSGSGIREFPRGLVPISQDEHRTRARAAIGELERAGVGVGTRPLSNIARNAVIADMGPELTTLLSGVLTVRSGNQEQLLDPFGDPQPAIPRPELRPPAPSEALGRAPRQQSVLTDWLPSEETARKLKERWFFPAAPLGLAAQAAAMIGRSDAGTTTTTAAVAAFVLGLAVRVGAVDGLRAKMLKTNRLHELESGAQAQVVRGFLEKTIAAQPAARQQMLMHVLSRNWDRLCEPVFHLCSAVPEAQQEGAMALAADDELSRVLGLKPLQADARAEAWELLHLLGSGMTDGGEIPELAVLNSDQMRRAGEEFLPAARMRMPTRAEQFWKSQAGLASPITPGTQVDDAAFVAAHVLSKLEVPLVRYADMLDLASCLNRAETAPLLAQFGQLSSGARELAFEALRTGSPLDSERLAEGLGTDAELLRQELRDAGLFDTQGELTADGRLVILVKSREPPVEASPLSR